MTIGCSIITWRVDFLIAGAAHVFRHLHAHQVGLTHRSIQVVLPDQHGTHLSNACESTNGEVFSPAGAGDFSSQRPKVSVGRQGVDSDAGAIRHFQMIEMQLQVAAAVRLSHRSNSLRSGGHNNLAIVLVAVFDDRDHRFIDSRRYHRGQPGRKT